MGVWSVALLLPLALAGALTTVEKIRPGSDNQTTLTVEFIRQNTGPQDTVLLWGTQTVVYFLAERGAPTRFVHQIPLFNQRYATGEIIGEFLADLEQRAPALIIDTRLDSMPLPYSPDGAARCGQTDRPIPAGMEQVYSFICANYERVTEIGPDSWIVYRYNPAIHADQEKR